MQKFGVLTSLAGAVPFWWGAVEWVSANSDVHSLETTRPRQSSVFTIPLTEHQAVGVFTGGTPTVGYAARW